VALRSSSNWLKIMAWQKAAYHVKIWQRQHLAWRGCHAMALANMAYGNQRK